MFNFFKKKVEREVPTASMTFSVMSSGKSNDEFSIEVSLIDYEPDSLEAFAKLFAAIPSHQFSTASLNVIQEAFEIDGKSKEFETFAISALLKAEKLYKEEESQGMYEEGSNQGEPGDPVIKPTDLV